MRTPYQDRLRAVESMVGNGQEIPDERNAEVALQAIVNYIIFSKPYISLAGFGDDDT
jgi:hypothetical protein